MRIIISPAKKMKVDEDSLDYRGLPVFLQRTDLSPVYLENYRKTR